MRPHLAADPSLTEVRQHCIGGSLGNFLEPARISRLDFVAKRRALAEPDRRVSMRRRVTGPRPGLNLNLCEAGRPKLVSNCSDVGVAVRCPCQEHPWILGKMSA